MKPSAAIVMGSDSDLPSMKAAIPILEQMGIDFEVHVISAHRTPEAGREFALNAPKKFEVIIAGAGGAAHLAGAMAAWSELPIIGVPLASGALNGVDALYATVQMPAGIPVATVAINNAANAALLAAQIIAIKHPEVAEKVREYRKSQSQKVVEKNQKLQQLGVEQYLNGGKQ